MKITYKGKIKNLFDLLIGDCFRCGDNIYSFVKMDPNDNYICYNFSKNSIDIFHDGKINVILKELELVVSDVQT